MAERSVVRSLREVMEGRRGHEVVFLDDGRGYCIHHECDFVATGHADADEHERSMKSADAARRSSVRSARRLGGWIGG